MRTRTRRFQRLLAVSPLAAIIAASSAFAGDCCTANSTPGCDDPACVAAVCPLDPFCCNIEWDLICVLAAEDLCGCGGPSLEACETSTNDCFSAGTGPGCADFVCCPFVCNADPSCCVTDWDQFCAAIANEFCEGGPVDPPTTGCGTAPNDCFTTALDGGCSDAICCEAVCDADPFCCNYEWDLLCVLGALALCEPEPVDDCPVASNPCYIATNAPGCEDPSCCVPVCNVDPACCVIGWDTACVQTALGLCDLAPSCGTSANDCFAAGVGPGCSDVECCETICALAPSCCQAEWDAFCASNANLLCEGGPPDPPSGCGISENDCFTVSQFPGCADEACCETVCDTDLFCCNTAWDLLCVQGAQSLCDGGVTVPPEACTTATNGCLEVGGPGCEDTGCCQFVCAQDPLCCILAWDAICVAAAEDVCIPTEPQQSVCGESSHACTDLGGPGCADSTCCAMVCSFVPDCCNTSWDAMCVDLALRGCVLPGPGDFNGDGSVNGFDLGVLLASWGPCSGCNADLDGSGNVDGGDLAFLLSIWSN
jgi:hypothetical protein